jgi:hypothetical protein
MAKDEKPTKPTESKVLKQIHSEIDVEPTGAHVLSRVIRLERVVEKLAKGASLDELHGEPEEDKGKGK